MHFLFLSVYLFPPILLAIPLFVAFSKLGLRGDLWLLVIVYVAQTLPICVYMLRNYFETVPISLEEAAEVDGATRLQIIRKVTLPLAIPAIAATGLFVFMIAWNEFLFALLFLVEERPELDGLARRVAAHQHRDAGDDADGGLGDPDRADHRALPVRRAADDRGPHAGRGEGMTASLRRPPRAVLTANWRGASTVPSGRQYPHQWGWDAAYIAIGWSWVDPARAAAELESLLRGQWPDGRVPHIVFHPDVPEDAYFPGPAFWESDVDGVATSGLTQPPLHARAALEVARRSDDGDARSCGACSGASPTSTPTSPGAATSAAAGWRRSCTRGSPGSTTARPGTSRWPRSSCRPRASQPYERQDRRHVDACERPDDAAYDRFVHLARAYRDAGYADDGRSAFLVEDPLFNAIWLWSTHALVEIAELIGEDPGPHRESAARIHDGAARAALGRRALPRRATCGPTG